jgi:hypothetical protein
MGKKLSKKKNTKSNHIQNTAISCAITFIALIIVSFAINKYIDFQNFKIDQVMARYPTEPGQGPPRTGGNTNSGSKDKSNTGNNSIIRKSVWGSNQPVPYKDIGAKNGVLNGKNVVVGKDGYYYKEGKFADGSKKYTKITKNEASKTNWDLWH